MLRRNSWSSFVRLLLLISTNSLKLTHHSQRDEVLEERLETDRSIIRNLPMAAQHWEDIPQSPADSSEPP